ncbi:hypothetical protein [Amycolatopsis sp. DSM 110486]|uniref:hypothetical protein n=1 Tax=Amycolatopsis sp. DSM 110486 TaxID=2865832 RepID=UPI001C6A67C4|nr:hypothetical protein [Amycolatopsis sp. DSM 110486]QYN17505.1 hypothetical protein K1T34_32485 [Amycolatopsis sp. DSM 110486]
MPNFRIKTIIGTSSTGRVHSAFEPSGLSHCARARVTTHLADVNSHTEADLFAALEKAGFTTTDRLCRRCFIDHVRARFEAHIAEHAKENQQ